MSWAAAMWVLLALALAGGFAWYERSRPPARLLALVAGLAALAVAGRIAFAPFPNVKPTTDLVLFAGYALGGVPGFAVGAVTAIASNLFFGQGPWTPWQMAGWGLVGVLGGVVGRRVRSQGEGAELGRWRLAAACALGGLLFGVVMDTYQWTITAERNLGSFVAVSSLSVPYNAAHVIANVAFALAIGPPIVRALRRYRRRFEVRWAPPVPARAAPLAAIPLVVVTGLTAMAALQPANAHAASSAARAERYLLSAQNRDGGFGAARGQASNDLHTGWAALGLAAAGRNPRRVCAGGRSVLGYIRAHARDIDDLGAIERTILVLHAAGASPRRFAGRDLAASLRRRVNGGRFDGSANHIAFGIFALRASGHGRGSSVIRTAAAGLVRAQHRDGGWGAGGRPSDADTTASALEALAAAGRRGSPSVRRGLSFLRRVQNGDGGFGLLGPLGSNAQSTAWAVRALYAVRRSPGSFRRGVRTPLGYIRSLQRRDGSFRYSRASGQTPVWVTADVLTALHRRPFPLARVRGGSGRCGSGAGATGGAGGAAKTGPGGLSGSPEARAAAAHAEAKAAALAARDRQAAAAGAVGPIAAERTSATDGDRGSVLAAVIAAVATLVVLGLLEWRRWLREPIHLPPRGSKAST